MPAIMFDLEADGFVDESTMIHCLVGKELNTGDINKFYQDTLDDMITYLSVATTIMGHNIIGYDFPMLKKFYGWEVPRDIKIVDTMIWSQTLNPDRQLPRGCPTSYKNPLTGKLERITPHSVAAWGYRVARAKPQHYDWSVFTPEMLHRCTEDVNIQEMIFYELLKEAGLTMEDIE